MLKFLFKQKNDHLKKKAVFVHKYLVNEFESIAKNTVDIPEFMKPKSEQHTTLAWRTIKQAIKNNKFEILYKQAIAAA